MPATPSSRPAALRPHGPARRRKGGRQHGGGRGSPLPKQYQICPDRLVGIAVTRHGYGEDAGSIPVIEAGTPYPISPASRPPCGPWRSPKSAGPEDFVLVLLSGGGSANWIAPAGALTLEEKQGITRALLRSGAPIDEINTVSNTCPGSRAAAGPAGRPGPPAHPRHFRRAARRSGRDRLRPDGA